MFETQRLRYHILTWLLYLRANKKEYICTNSLRCHQVPVRVYFQAYHNLTNDFSYSFVSDISQTIKLIISYHIFESKTIDVL